MTYLSCFIQRYLLISTRNVETFTKKRGQNGSEVKSLTPASFSLIEITKFWGSTSLVKFAKRAMVQGQILNPISIDATDFSQVIFLEHELHSIWFILAQRASFHCVGRGICSSSRSLHYPVFCIRVSIMFPLFCIGKN